MKLTSLLKTSVLLTALPLAAWAQTGATTTATPTTTTNTANFQTGDFGGARGDRELILGGSGGSNKDFDDSFGGVNASLGTYINDMLAVVIRQTLNYTNPDNGGKAWNGSTRLALDWHFGQPARIRPFVGANFGRIYGDNVNDTWAAGLEGGVKFYVQPRTFVFAMAEYAWAFDDGDDLDDRFEDGQVLYGIGVGFNF